MNNLLMSDVVFTTVMLILMVGLSSTEDCNRGKYFLFYPPAIYIHGFEIAKIQNFWESSIWRYKGIVWITQKL